MDVELIKKYYADNSILTKLLHFMRYRENVLLKQNGRYPVRCVCPGSITGLIQNIDRFDVCEEQYNIYSSVATYNFYQLSKDTNLIPFSFNLKKRKNQIKEFGEICNDYQIKIDFVLDFDVHDDDYEKTFDEVVRTCEFFNNFKSLYSVRFSGRGFHIVIDSKYLPDRLDECDFYHHIALKLQKLLDLSTLDLSIYDDRRVIKTPYSIDHRSGLCCIPINRFKVESFNKSEAKINYVLENHIKTDLQEKRVFDERWFVKIIEEVGLDAY